MPYAWEGSTAAEYIAGRAFVSAGNDGYAGGFYNIIVTWEPPEDMAFARWQYLRDNADVAVLTQLFDVASTP
jgi:hypothetical protein